MIIICHREAALATSREQSIIESMTDEAASPPAEAGPLISGVTAVNSVGIEPPSQHAFTKLDG